MCTLTSRRTPLMPSGSRTSSCPSMMNSCGRMCRICWSFGIAIAFAVSTTRSMSACGDFLFLDRDHAARVEAADVAAGDAGVDLGDPAVRHQLGFLEHALDRRHRRLDVDDDALLQPARRLRAEPDDVELALRRRPRRRSRRSSTCRCRGRRSGFCCPSPSRLPSGSLTSSSPALSRGNPARAPRTRCDSARSTVRRRACPHARAAPIVRP